MIDDGVQIDWKAVDAKLDTMFAKDCDTYLMGAAALFNKPAEQVTKNERSLVKLVFMRAFRVRGPVWVQSAFEFADAMANVLQDRGLYTEVAGEAHKRMLAADDAAEAAKR